MAEETLPQIGQSTPGTPTSFAFIREAEELAQAEAENVGEAVQQTANVEAVNEGTGLKTPSSALVVQDATEDPVLRTFLLSAAVPASLEESKDRRSESPSTQNSSPTDVVLSPAVEPTTIAVPAPPLSLARDDRKRAGEFAAAGVADTGAEREVEALRAALARAEQARQEALGQLLRASSEVAALARRSEAAEREAHEAREEARRMRNELDSMREQLQAELHKAALREGVLRAALRSAEEAVERERTNAEAARREAAAARETAAREAERWREEFEARLQHAQQEATLARERTRRELEDQYEERLRAERTVQQEELEEARALARIEARRQLEDEFQTRLSELQRQHQDDLRRALAAAAAPAEPLPAPAPLRPASDPPALSMLELQARLEEETRAMLRQEQQQERFEEERRLEKQRQALQEQQYEIILEENKQLMARIQALEKELASSPKAMSLSSSATTLSGNMPAFSAISNDVAALQKELASVQQALLQEKLQAIETEKLYELQVTTLKTELKKHSQCDNVNLSYLKNVIFKFLTLENREQEASLLILQSLFQFSSEEMAILERVYKRKH